MSVLPTGLCVQPKDVLTFTGPFEEVSTCVVNLVSTRTDKPIYFKVKTTAPKLYCVKPNRGLIVPNGCTSISVMLQPVSKFNIDEYNAAKHKFLIQATTVKNEQEANVLKDNMWSVLLPERVEVHKLKCVFRLPNQNVMFSRPLPISLSHEEPSTMPRSESRLRRQETFVRTDGSRDPATSSSSIQRYIIGCFLVLFVFLIGAWLGSLYTATQQPPMTNRG